MILQNLSKAIREQNYYAVVLEFVIVIAGVVIGFQINAWNEARSARADERMLLSRLAEEFESIQGPLSEARVGMAAAMAATGEVIDAIREGEPPQDEATFRESLRLANYVYDSPSLATSYSELLATGGMVRISDRNLRVALTAYGDLQAQIQRTYTTAHSVVFDQDSAYLQAVSWSTDPTTWSGPDAIIAYNFEALRAAEAEMQMWQGLQEMLLRRSEEQAALIDEILARLEESRDA